MGESWSHIFTISSGARQGSVWSPVLFPVDIDDIGELQNNLIGTFVALCADDIAIGTVGDSFTDIIAGL